MKVLKWTLENDADADAINKIAWRAVDFAKRIGAANAYSVIEAHMDLTACHLNGCPLQLAELLDADDANFAHDIFGIRRHIDRSTGQLRDCFVPRYAKIKEEA